MYITNKNEDKVTLLWFISQYSRITENKKGKLKPSQISASRNSLQGKPEGHAWEV